MNNKSFWVASVIVGVIIVVGGIVGLNINKNKEDRTLRVAFPIKDPIEKYEPTNIHFAYEYLLLENLYSSLVEINPKTGAIEPGIAEHYSWTGDALELQIRSDLKTRSGKSITAEDVIFSLKRLLVLSGNTHGNFKDLVCPNIDLESVEQSCEGIELRGDKIILKAGKRRAFLLPMLTTVDFAIIPKHVVDPKTLKIQDYSETSGIYWVSGDDKRGTIELTVNPTHYHYSTQIPQKVVFVPTDLSVQNSALALFKEGKADHLMTYSGTRPEEIIKEVESSSEINLHMTMKIQTIVLVFTDKGRRELSPEYRRYIGNQTKQAFQEIFGAVKGYEKTDEFFPAFGDGGLSKERREKLNQVFSTQSKNVGERFRLAFLKAGDLNPWFGPVSKRLPQANIYLEKNIPAMHKYEKASDEPHAVIMSTDSGFKEDISLISYSLNAGIFGLDKKSRGEWVASYMELTNEGARLEALRKLHFDALANPDLVPLVVFPYAAITRKPWKMELSEIYANNPLWLIKQ